MTPSISIIIPFYNAYDYTQLCIESISECTKVNYELILVDNGSNSNPEFINYLQSFSEVKIITNDINKGFPFAVNQGLAIATGDIICILNNDLIVTPDWSDHLLWHLDHGLDVVGPRTNYIDGPQILLVDVYRDKQELYEVAKEHYKKNRHKKWAFPRLVGFCLMFKKDVYEKIGGFDEIFGLGNFEDDLFCCQAIRNGFIIGIALDCFLHHFGSITHKLLNFDYNELLNKNQKLFLSKVSNEEMKELSNLNKERFDNKNLKKYFCGKKS